MSLATVEDYERLTGVDVPTEDEPRVQALLDVASAAIQGATGQTIERARTIAEVVIAETPAEALLLDEGPVYEASPDDEVVVRDPAGDVVPRDHYSVLVDSAMLKHCDCHRWAAGCYEVDYSHGHDPVPPDVVALVVGSAARILAPALAGIAAQSAGSWSVTYRDDAGVGGLVSVGGSVVDRYSLGRGA